MTSIGPFLLPEAPTADLHLCGSRWDYGPPPSALRPCAPDAGAVKATDGAASACPSMQCITRYAVS